MVCTVGSVWTGPVGPAMGHHRSRGQARLTDERKPTLSRLSNTLDDVLFNAAIHMHTIMTIVCYTYTSMYMYNFNQIHTTNLCDFNATCLRLVNEHEIFIDSQCYGSNNSVLTDKKLLSVVNKSTLFTGPTNHFCTYLGIIILNLFH